MLPSTTPPTSPALTTVELRANLRKLLLDEHGKLIFGEKNPKNVERRFTAIETWLEELRATYNTAEDIRTLTHTLEALYGSWRNWPINSEDLRRFVLVVRSGHKDLETRDLDPNLFVPHEVRCLAIRLYEHQCSYRDI